MTPVVLATPANWRTFYERRPCLCCGSRALFHKDAALQVCDGCFKDSKRVPERDLQLEIHPSETLYHGAPFGDDQ